ncbi:MULTISPECIES: ExbD/TolR family protein [unclassified Sphingomonas]|jgi:biopolymer transport protein ExbD|uniref:ExbD/TolR family protein n=1 Tax=unclassified Sphingomonas TaxID=196159 RepID=UPI0006FC227B|nr:MULTISPECIES: biopolymer transporter ExbD [unclassified Sphingomonas]KQO06125.1 biopolymer transporter ExbD [Sphingomonas sp. Leaf242]KQS48918.1 biopolymer transporter ExbD [Sphingomonas sp. Leaf198]RMB26179.1 outer membrane transport energization protein ExbD [Sphingomonas sp. PP-F2F-G114-C0414]RMB53770.1 outer membrane transport energization protein ExbD [Sphingomonas sp. PP-CE-3A-406]TCP71873.1 outer membrane transport energization protein ExbD [Sphingomonas sp. PP-CE-1G-424]
MAMSVGGDSTESSISDINTTPLVDVMLVLLIIFLVTTTVAVQAVQLKLPDVRFDPTMTKPENVSLSVTSANGQCQVYWGLSPVTHEELLQRGVDKLKAEIARQGGANAAGLELPEAHIRGDVNAPYRCIGATIYTMQQAGFARVGFISEPPPGVTTER